MGGDLQERERKTNFMLYGPCIMEGNCLMTNVMHKFLIYVSIYFCLTCFGLSFSPFSEAGVHLKMRALYSLETFTLVAH
jgi:hypothetical protein